jgi:hypothetical protein
MELCGPVKLTMDRLQEQALTAPSYPKSARDFVGASENFRDRRFRRFRAERLVNIPFVSPLPYSLLYRRNLQLSWYDSMSDRAGTSTREESDPPDHDDRPRVKRKKREWLNCAGSWFQPYVRLTIS